MTEVRLIKGSGGLVTAVESGSLAEEAGIRPDDRLAAINGQKLRDVIDYQYYSSDDRLTLDVERNGVMMKIEVENEDGEPLGLEFENPTFDRLRTCNNNCPFCFLKGLPRGLRQSLYIKDDDYRYSFLYGNFVTLTNLTQADWARVFEQQLSPLYVSVHATEPDVRRLMLGNPRAPEIMPQIDTMSKAGIQIHTQVVLCPDQNDGEHLDRTVEDLSSRFPTVRSIGIVPVGLTPRQTDLLAGKMVDVEVGSATEDGHGGGHLPPDELLRLRTETHCERVVPSAVRLFTTAEARRVVAQLTNWQRTLRKRTGMTLAHPSDEFYLLAEEPVPSGRHYDGYPQYENGIGMVRSLLDEWQRTRRHLSDFQGPKPRRKAGLVCGQLASNVLRPIVDELNEFGFDVTLLPITNQFFGPSITVSGLLTATDLRAGLAGSQFDVLFLPRYMLDVPGKRTLDGWTPDEIRAELRAEVIFTTSTKTVAGILTRPQADAQAIGSGPTALWPAPSHSRRTFERRTA